MRNYRSAPKWPPSMTPQRDNMLVFCRIDSVSFQCETTPFGVRPQLQEDMKIFAAGILLASLSPAYAGTWQCTDMTGHTYTSSQNVASDRCEMVSDASPYPATTKPLPAASTAAGETGLQRCPKIKIDKQRLECFDLEIKSFPSAFVASAATSANSRSRSSTDACFTGPRGGRYRIVNGHKRYDC